MARGFALAGLLRLRTLQEEQAAAELARANADLRAAERRREQTAQMLAGTSLPVHADSLTWRASIASRAALSALTVEATAMVEAGRHHADEASDGWSAARRAARALEILRERHDVEVRAAEQAAEQLVLDEAAARSASAPTAPGTPGLTDPEEGPR